MRVMDPNGKAVGEPVLHGGMMDLSGFMEHFSALKTQAADFPSKETADAAAKGFGWTVVDGNHRCPACYEGSYTRDVYPGVVERRGCYINWDLQRQPDGPDRPEAT
jgi:hypothetical protein